MRIRISSVILIIGILFTPFSLFWVSPIFLPEKGGMVRNLFLWLQYDLSITLFAIAFVIDLVIAGVFAFRRNWKGFAQCSVEMLVCSVGVLFAPAY